MITRSSALFRIACPWLLSGAIASAQTGTGLTAKYYDTDTFGTLKTTRTDATVNFNFGTAIPSGTAITAATTYSIAWSGQIEPQYSELYTFTITADDGARLWVDDQLIVGRTFHQSPGELRGQIRLKAGKRVNLRLEYTQGSGNASVKLEWASASQTKQVVPTNRLYTTTETPNGGSLMREVWTGLPGNSLTTLTSNANYPNKPASRDFITSFECIARDWEDSFGTRVTGFIRPSVSGSYTFAVSGDDVVQLYLSTDATSANRSLIASVTSATGFRQWDAQPSQQSTARTLVAGQRYYVEVLHKEDSAADHWSVGWKPPGDAAFSVIPGTALMMPGTDNAQPSSSSNFFDTLATEHPRLGVSRERFLWLRQMWLSSTSSAAKTRAQSVLNTATGELTAAPTIQRGAQDRIQRLALAWWLTGDNQYAEAAWTNINHCITNGDWTDPWKGVENGVIATGYDWLYPYWSKARKDAMTNCMVTKGFSTGWTESYGNNIGVIINSGHLMAILAVGMVNEVAAEPKLGSAIGRLSSKIDKWNANAGAWYEGTGYGILTKWDLAQAMPAMETALGSTWGLSRIAGVSTTAREPLTIADNTRGRFSFADVGTPSEAAIGWANWFARRYNALEIFDYSRQIGNSPLNALTLPESTLSPATAGLNPDTAFRGPIDSAGGSSYFQEVVTLRENWTDTKATFVGAKGGGYGATTHAMLESGTFQLSARGQRWFIDLSSESYDVPNHNTIPVNPNGRDRWDYYRNRAEGHNTIVINPGSGPDRVIDNDTTLLNFQSAPGGQRSFAVWDLAPTMNTPVTKVQRGVQLLGNRRQVLVQDEIVTPSPTTVWWFAHYSIPSTTVTISADGSSVMMQKGSERLWGKIISGGGVFTAMAAAPLPTSPNPPENTPNTSANKLAIQLTGVTNTTLAVWFVPLAPGENPPATQPVITPLAQWNLVADNEPPIASNGNANSAGTTPVDVSLPAYVTDDWTPASQMTYAVSAPVGGTVALLPGGLTARFTPTPGFTGLQAFAFTATDADGATSNTGTVTFSVPPVVANWTSPASGNWSTTTNWQGTLAPVSSPGSEIQFFSGQTPASGTITTTNNLPGTTALNRLTLAGTGTATTIVNLDGNALQLVGNGIAQPLVTLSGNTSGFRYQIANNLTLSETTNFNAIGSATFLFTGAITGPGGLVRNSSTGTLILAGNNSYSGPTTINAGTLQIGNDGAVGTLGNGPVTIASGATLRFDRTGSVLVSNDITGAGRVIVNGATSSDVVSLGGDNDFTGEVRVDNGSLRVSDAHQLGTGTKNIISASSTALLRIDGSGAPVVFPADFSVITSNPNGAILNEAGDNQILGNLTLGSGAGGTRLTVGSGSLTIGGTVTSSFTGRSLDLRGTGLGIINGNFIDGAGANTISGFSKNDTGTWTLNGNNSISCTTVVSGGKLVINGNHASGNVSVASGATLAGEGSLTAATTITGTLAPGDGVGTMNFGSTLSFGSASKLQWEIASNSLVADQALAAGALSVTSGAKIDLVLNRPGSTANFRLSFWRSSRTWPVASGSSRTGTFQLGTVSADSSGHPAATYGSFSLQHTTTGVSLVWTPIPGFPVIDEPLVTFLQPLANPVVLPNAESTLRIAATATGTGPITYAWSTLSVEEGGNGTVSFGNPAAADTTVRISETGRYIVRCTATNSAVSSSADLTIDVGPPADDDFSQTVAVIDPGLAPTAAAGFIATLAGSVSNASSSQWTLVSGPGTASFFNSASPTTPVVFSQSGSYILRLTATTAIGQAWRDLAVTVSTLPAGFEAWQAANWPGVTDSNVIGPNADPDGDGATNAAEFLAGTDPTTNTSVPSFVWTQTLGGSWSGAANWNLGVVPPSNPLTKIEFLTSLTPAGNLSSQQDLGASLTLQRLALNGTGPSTTTLTGGALSFATGGIIDLGNGGILYDLAIPLDLSAPTILQGSPTAETCFSGGLTGAASLTKNSTGILEISGSHSLAGALNINAGTLRVSGAGTSSGAITVKGSTLTISGSGAIAPATGAGLNLGSSGGSGTLQYGSTATSKFAGIVVGNGTNSAGILNQTNGTIHAASIVLSNSFSGGSGNVTLGNESGNATAMNVSGNATISNASSGAISTLTVKNTGSLTIAGNLLFATSTNRPANGALTQSGGTVSAGAISLAGNINDTSARTHTGVYHLDGGTLTTGPVTAGVIIAHPTTGSHVIDTTFNFNGGTLKPTASHGAFLQGLTRANVRNGGALIDTGASNITIAQPLLHSAVGGDAATDGGLTKSGAGKLTLTATSTYTGPTTIQNGTLELGTLAALSSTSSIVIHPAAVLNLLPLTSHALSADQPVTFKLDGTDSGTCGRIQAAALNITAAKVVFDIVAPLDDPAYILANYTSKTGGVFANVTPPPGYVLNYAYDGNQIALVSTSGYAGWINNHPGLLDNSPAGDPDHDDIENLLEYVLNGNPSISDSEILPDLDASGPDFVFTFTRRELSSYDTTQVFEYGTDLGGWTPLNITHPTAGQIALGTPADGLQTVTISIPKSLASPGGKLFGRLRVIQP